MPSLELLVSMMPPETIMARIDALRKGDRIMHQQDGIDARNGITIKAKKPSITDLKAFSVFQQREGLESNLQQANYQ
jgi:hypothetical protein